MAKWAALFHYSADQARIQEVRPEHRAYLRRLRDAGTLHEAGRFGHERGGLIVYRAASEAEARALFDDDPFTKNGIMGLDEMVEWLVVVSAVEEAG